MPFVVDWPRARARIHRVDTVSNVQTPIAGQPHHPPTHSTGNLCHAISASEYAGATCPTHPLDVRGPQWASTNQYLNCLPRSCCNSNSPQETNRGSRLLLMPCICSIRNCKNSVPTIHQQYKFGFLCDACGHFRTQRCSPHAPQGTLNAFHARTFAAFAVQGRLFIQLSREHAAECLCLGRLSKHTEYKSLLQGGLAASWVIRSCFVGTTRLMPKNEHIFTHNFRQQIICKGRHVNSVPTTTWQTLLAPCDIVKTTT